MHEIKIYDRARVPPNWTDVIDVNQYVVFQHQTHTGIPVSPTGSTLPVDASGSCLVFDTLDEAERYCAARVEDVSGLTCEIYDKSGRGGAPIRSYVDPSVHTADRSLFRSRFFWAHIMTIIGVIGLVIDSRSDWVRMWPTILGLKFLTLALLFYVWGLAEKLRGHPRFRQFDK